MTPDTTALADKVAVITGAGHGIGRALAMEAASRGMHLELADLDGDAVAAVAERARATHLVEARGHRADVRDPHGLAGLSTAAFAGGREVAMVFANAGVGRFGSLISPDLEAADLMIDVNLRGVVHTVAAFLDPLLAQGRRAQFVIMGSQASLVAFPRLGLYGATKHALWALAESLQLELQARAAPVEVSLVCPGAVSTEIMAKDAAGGAPAKLGSMSPERLARVVFDRLGEGRFWIFPHPDFKSAMQARFDRVVEEDAPVAWT